MSFSDFRPFGGWSRPSIKQYRGDITACGVGIDADWYPGAAPAPALPATETPPASGSAGAPGTAAGSTELAAGTTQPASAAGTTEPAAGTTEPASAAGTTEPAAGSTAAGTASAVPAASTTEAAAGSTGPASPADTSAGAPSVTAAPAPQTQAPQTQAPETQPPAPATQNPDTTAAGTTAASMESAGGAPHAGASSSFPGYGIALLACGCLLLIGGGMAIFLRAHRAGVVEGILCWSVDLWSWWVEEVYTEHMLPPPFVAHTSSCRASRPAQAARASVVSFSLLTVLLLRRLLTVDAGLRKRPLRMPEAIGVPLRLSLQAPSCSFDGHETGICTAFVLFWLCMQRLNPRHKQGSSLCPALPFTSTNVHG